MVRPLVTRTGGPDRASCTGRLGCPRCSTNPPARRRDGGISREGSVELCRAFIDLGTGLWHSDQPAKAYAAGLKARGKHSGIIACALAHRANRIAYALTRDRTAYDPARWTR